MGSPRILLVEDNPLTRGVVREMLLSGGYEVEEAPDGGAALDLAARRRPDLVLQDMALPDMDGMELLRRLRGVLGAGVPIVALSGLPAELQRAQGEEGIGPGLGFTDYLTKPISSSALLLAVQAHVSAGAVAGEDREPGRRRVLVVEEPGAMEALGLQLDQAGFELTLAPDAAAALGSALRAPPSAVVAGALLPGGDGFRLCREFRAGPALSRVPVVLVSGVFTEEEDRDLARHAGANALVAPGEGVAALVAALREAVSAGPPPGAGAPGEEFEAALAERRHAALRREAHRAAELERRVAFQGAALSVVGVLASSLSRSGEAERAPGEILARCLTAAGTSRGAAFLRTPEGRLVLSARIGYPPGEAGALTGFFGHEALLLRALEEREPLPVPSDRVPAAEGEDLLARMGCRSAILVPLHLGAEGMGVLVMTSGRFDLHDWTDLARAVSSQVSHALSLGRAIAALASSEARHRNLFESAAFGIYRTAPGGVVAETNPALRRMLGLGEGGDVTGTEVAALCPRAEERAFLREKHRGSARFGGVEVGWDRPGRPPLRVRLSGHPVAEEGGAGGGFQVFVEDVTARREAEERRRGGDDLEMVRRLAGSAAHDFNNLLTAVAGHAELLERSLDQAPDLREHARRIAECVKRSGRVTAELVAFSRSGGGATQALDLHAAVEESAPLLHRILGEEVTLSIRRGSGAALVFVDPEGLSRALAAMAARARAVAPAGGALEVETGAVVLDEAFARSHPGVVPGAYGKVTARDGGSPLDDAAGSRVFEPGAEGAGGGGVPGLAAVADFARRSGGFALLRSGPGRGNAVRMYLPLVRDASGGETAAPREAEPTTAEVRPAPPAEGVVLLAEDEKAVRDLIAETLRLEGITVLTAGDGEEALRVAEAAGRRIDLLVTDLAMPRMGGAPLAERLRAVLPGLPVIVITGHLGRTAGGAPASPVPGAAVLLKPFMPAALMALVREGLAAGRKGGA